MDYGEKANSLLELKKKGLFGQNLFVLENLPEKKEFFKKMIEEGFEEGQDIAVRFSSPQKTINLPRSIILNSFESVYTFITKSCIASLFPIVHNFVTPEFEGSLIKHKDKIYVNFTNGTWEQQSSKNCDTLVIEGKKTKVWFYPNEKDCLFVAKDKLINKKVKNSKKEIVDVSQTILKKIKSLQFEENILYEFILTFKKDFVIMEYKNWENFSEPSFLDSEKNLFVVEKIQDLEKWDGIQNIFLDLFITRENDRDLFKAIELIKPIKNFVYASYGICSHPAIILREFGIEMVPYQNDYEYFELIN